jgi:hypothetical protein
MQIDYTSRDFTAIKADLIAMINAKTGKNWDPTDYSDLGHILVESFAYMGDIMSHYLDKAANETSIDTAVKLDTLLSFASLYDYKPSGPTPAYVAVTFTNTSDQPIDIPIGTQVMAPLSYGAYSQVYYETTQSATALAAGASITLDAYEGMTVNTDRPDLIDPTYNKALPSNLGTSDGTANQSFTVYQTGVVDSSINVYVGQSSAFSTWTYVDNLLESNPTDNVFTTKRGSDGTMAIVFGDGVNGAIPSANQTISSVFKTSVGLAGNVKSLSVTECTFVPGNLDPQTSSYLSVSNPLAATGGANADSLEDIRIKIKAAVSSRRRAVTLKDYSDLALMVPQVGKANAAASVYSSVNVYLQTQADGNAAPGYNQFIISNAVGSGTAVTYTIANSGKHSLAVGDIVDISGIYIVGAPPTTGYNLQNATVASVSTDMNSFTVTSAVTGTYDNTSTIYGSSRTGLVIKEATSGGAATTTNWNTIKTAVAAYLADKTPAGVTVNILPPTYVPIYLTATVTISPSYKQSDVRLAIYQAMLGVGGYFEYTNNTFGDTLYVSNLTSVIQAVPGVLAVNVTQFSTNGATSVATSIALSANQIPYLTPTNLVSNITGGIA